MTQRHSDYTILSGREVKLLNRRESNYPQLSSLCVDFAFIVMEMLVSETDSSQLWGKKYTLLDNTASLASLTPHFNDLAELESYCKENLVTIIGDFLEQGPAPAEVPAPILKAVDGHRG